MNRQVTATLHLIGFFSRLPVPPPREGARLSDSAALLPVAAVAVALPSALAFALLGAVGAAPPVVAVLATGVAVVVTGALHEDGLADCADGFFGGAERTRRLEIMRDSRIGSYGVLALILALTLKMAVLAELAAAPLAGACVLLAAAVVARTVALFVWVALPPARADGLAVHVGQPTLAAFRTAVALAIPFALALAGWVSLSGTLILLVSAAAVAKGVAVLADRAIGGHTGDVIGAAVVTAELASLTAFLIWIGR